MHIRELSSEVATKRNRFYMYCTSFYVSIEVKSKGENTEQPENISQRNAGLACSELVSTSLLLYVQLHQLKQLHYEQLQYAVKGGEARRKLYITYIY